jgi:AmmeMemoRadiSam system protein B
MCPAKMVERLLLDRVDTEAGRAAVGRQDDLVVLTATHEAQTALPLVQLAIAGAQVALNAPVIETVPVPAWPALQDLLIHVAPDLKFETIYTSRYHGSAGQLVRKISQDMKVRPPAVAGQFYAGHRDQLRTQVTELLASAPTSRAVSPKALIVPHAGYIYSGQVAATAFVLLQNSAPTERVVVIGPAHYVPVRGIAIPTADAFETPLGRLPVDRDALDAITDLSFVISADGPHAPEHALEVELPFLQTLLRPFAVVPLLVGDTAPKNVADVLRRLWGGPEALIVVSSDLSHYHDYDTARRLDAATADAIECYDWGYLGPNNACGFLPIAGLLIEAARRGLRAQRLSLCNSGDATGGRGQVVGYGAWIFEEKGAASR